MNNQIRVHIQIENQQGKIDQITYSRTNTPELFNDLIAERKLFNLIFGETLPEGV